MCLHEKKNLEIRVKLLIEKNVETKLKNKCKQQIIKGEAKSMKHASYVIDRKNIRVSGR
jgi:hypothetical protein